MSLMPGFVRNPLPVLLTALLAMKASHSAWVPSHTTYLSVTQFRKAFAPIEVTVRGMAMILSLLQSKKA